MFYAHSKNSAGKKHLLKEHLESTAGLTQLFAPSTEHEQLFYLAGLLHDVGKFQEGFQRYLEYGKPKTPHAGIGAFISRIIARQLLPLPFVIQGHHAGLPDKQELIDNLAYYEEDKETVRIIRDLFENFCGPIKTGENISSNDSLFVETLTRLVFSAVTDADWLDTERHFSQKRYDTRGDVVLYSNKSHKHIIGDELLKMLETKFASLPTEGKINNLRTQARNEAARKFSNPLGFFSLQLPTGLGKTLTSTYWTLLHARQHKLKRIIIVLPYINIIDQTASILKDIFGEDVVFEHHSGIIDDDEDYAKETFDKSVESAKRLACENWEAPIIVTTAVQFFESLFSNRPFKCRKNHNIADSVVIFDEVQTLPKHLAEPTIVMLKNVASIARISFLFCTATMPAFGKREMFEGIETTMPLIKNPKKYFDATQRVNYKLLKGLKPVTLEEVNEKLLKETRSYLVIVNTKAVAKELYTKLINGNTHEQYYHLSTAMCPHHRKKRIEEIVNALGSESKRKIAVVSTQLVEAGVDFDFPCVYRAVAPLDSVIQAAGRCNRNGKVKKGKVVLFDLVDHKMPDSTYRSCADFAKGIIQDDPGLLHNADSFERYYEQVINLFVDADRYKITEERKNFNFKTVDAQYQIIERGKTAPLFIANYSDESKALLDEVTTATKFSGFITREQYRKIQQFSVQIYPDFLKKYSNQIETIKDTFRIWYGKYDENVGLSPEDVETVF